MLLLMLVFASCANAQVDIRIDGTSGLVAGDSIDYIATLQNCSSLATIEAGSNASLVSYSSSDVIADLATSDSCSLNFSLSGAERLSPLVVISRLGEARVQYAETFIYEQLLPSLNFESVEIVGDTGNQELVITVNASDDTDIAYLAFNTTGLNASDLRAAGGVVSQARLSAFADTESFQRLYPSRDEQTEFQFSVPVTTPLTAEQIAFDALVLLDVTVFDSSGNHTSISEVAFTGDAIQEEARALVVSTTGIVINNALQAPVIVPSVEFQFRGLVSLPGAGNNISYSSSHPNLIGVTSAGVVYALDETGSENVSIAVSYPGLSTVYVPVEADFSKILVGIGVDGVDVGNPFVLPSLNEFYGLPEIQGVFDDGSTTVISGHFTPILEIDSAASAYLESNRDLQLRSSVAIADSSPALVSLRIAELSGIESHIPVLANDAVPEIVLDLPSQVESQSELVLAADVNDDVGINGVEFFLNGASIGAVLQPPYQLTIPISEQFEGTTLAFDGKVTDTAGQTTTSINYEVVVNAPAVVSVPDYEFVLPVDGQRVVESSPTILQIETSLGLLPDVASSSGISNVEFFFDGALVGVTNFPSLEIRPTLNPDEDELFEIWKVDANVPAISTNETSLAVSAVVNVRNGSENSDARLIRIIENGPPQVSILAPQEGSQATAGQELDFQIEVVDDSLALGAQIELLLDGRIIETRQYQGNEAEVNALDTQSTIVRYTYPVSEEETGSTLEFQARVTDFHQSINLSSSLRIPVKSDQAPTIALSNPVAGASFVSGLPIQLRANAVDDIEVEKVDFYVNSQLVGTDLIPPYAFSYETQESINVEQVLSVYAAATDSAGQEATSNTVEVTLGQDEEPPVVNISSPLLTGVDSGSDIAGIIEESEFVFKISGFDNVAAHRAELRGVRNENGRYVLTGDPNDVLSDQEFQVEQIPGVLRAYSALRLIRAPSYINSTASEFDRYPLTVEVYDEAGNSSTANIIVGVFEDSPPEVVDIIAGASVYFNSDTVDVDILMRDDRAVERVEIEYKSDSSTFLSKSLDQDSGLVPMSTLQVRESLNLSDHSISNVGQVLMISVIAYDRLGQQSQEFEREIVIEQDFQAPIATISTPIQGSTLYVG